MAAPAKEARTASGASPGANFFRSAAEALALSHSAPKHGAAKNDFIGFREDPEARRSTVWYAPYYCSG
eukprot:gene18030-45996_t